MSLRGVGPLTALTLLVEVCDFARFGTAEGFMGFTGLTLSESSSGESRQQGSITKDRQRPPAPRPRRGRLGVQSRPARSPERMRRLAGQPPEVVALALASEQRLHRRWRIVRRGKLGQVAAVAVARELAGVVWALMRTERAA